MEVKPNLNALMVATTEPLMETTQPTSLEGLHSTVPVPPASAGFWRQLRAFAGPAFLVSVGYMDPGNWGTDLEGRGDSIATICSGSSRVASFMAIIMQVIAARLGIVTGKDLAQACRDYYPAWTRWPNWLFCETRHRRLRPGRGARQRRGHQSALPGIPLFWAVVITAFDVLLAAGAAGASACASSRRSFWCWSATIGGCYFIEIFVLPQTHPSFLEMGQALLDPGISPEDDRHDRPGHRHHRRHGDAAQSLPALGPGAIAQAARATTAGSSGRSASTRSIPCSPCRWPFLSTRPFSCWRPWSFTARQSVELSERRIVRSRSRRSRWTPTGFRSAYLTLATAAGRRGGQHPVRRRPVRERPEQHHHRHAGRAGRHGRIHALAHQAVGCAA